MRHSIHLPLTATLAFALLAGCQSGGGERISAEAREAQRTVENHVAEARAQANDNVMVAAYRADDETRHAEELAFIAERDALRDRTQLRLNELSQRANRIRNGTAPRDPYVDVVSAMANIDHRREAVRVDILRLEGTSADELPAMEQTISRHIVELEQAIREIAAK